MASRSHVSRVRRGLDERLTVPNPSNRRRTSAVLAGFTVAFAITMVGGKTPDATFPGFEFTI
jgi:hypothetical protein